MAETKSEAVQVLLIEDDPADVALAEESFKESQYPVQMSVIGDGMEALDYLQGRGTHTQVKRPDLILMDLSMPGKHGLELLNDIKKDTKLRDIPVLVLSTSQAPSDISKSYELGANCYVTKPSDFNEFKSTAKTLSAFWFGVAKLPRKGVS